MKKLLLFFAIVSVAGMLASCNGNGKTAEAGSEENAAEAEAVGMLQGYCYVDLGLSVNWATCNVGANAPEELGDYYAWGETSKKDNYTAESHKFYGGEGEFGPKYTKYTSDDNLEKLEVADDAASNSWGNVWRMPTKAEFQELIDKCTWTWKDNGYEVKGANGQTIFLPLTGAFWNGSVCNEKIDGLYWSSTADGSMKAYYLSFADQRKQVSCDGRYYGHQIRPVCAK
ncbi:MAG: hypothetical protein J5542_11500 [Bacteroidales bacterium]|nr:hypothetical protein [Bacteroidales bacterium]